MGSFSSHCIVKTNKQDFGYSSEAQEKNLDLTVQMKSPKRNEKKKNKLKGV